MKKTLYSLFVFLFGLFVLGSCVSFANEGGYSISDYSTDIQLNDEGELIVHEIISVDFSESRHGIYRDIPFRYTGVGDRKVKTQIYDVDVKGYEYTTQKHGDDFRIKIGSADSTVKGKQIYDIRYKVYGGIRAFDGYQELYWNMLGTQRPTPINNFSFTFTLPSDIALQNNEYYAISGTYGEKNKVKLIKAGNKIYSEGELDLDAYEGVTLAIKLPEKYVQLDWKKEFPRYYFIFLIPLCFGIYLYSLWEKYGKDEKVRDVIYYTPPKGLTPGQVASIYKKNPTDASVFSTIYSWATDGYIKIEHKKGGWLSKDIFTIEKIKDKKDLSDAELLLWDHFFDSSDKFSFGKENQSNTLFNKIKSAYKTDYDSIKERLFTPRSLWWKEKTSFFTAGGGGIMVLLYYLYSTVGQNLDKEYLISIFGSLAIMLVLFNLFAKYIDKLSTEGMQIYEQVAGFKKYMEKVEEPKLQQLITDDPQYFEKVLPFAVALGMETERIKKSASALQQTNYQPVWIYGSGFNNRDVNAITSSISSSIAGFGQASAFSAPSSSGGGGGGGFSGGGGGGGGGGSW